MNHRKIFAYYGPLIAFVILAIFGGVAIKQSADNTARETAILTAEAFHEAQVKLCEQTNELSKETNRRAEVDIILRNAVVDFIDVSRKARQGSLRDSTNRSASSNDRRTLARLTTLVKIVRREVIYHKVPILNCRETVTPARELK